MKTYLSPELSLAGNLPNISHDNEKSNPLAKYLLLSEQTVQSEICRIIQTMYKQNISNHFYTIERR